MGDSLVSHRSLEIVLEEPTGNAPEDFSSWILLKTEAARSPNPAPITSPTESFWGQMGSPWQEAPALFPSADDTGGLALLSQLGYWF